MRLVARSATVITIAAMMLSQPVSVSPLVERFDAFRGWVNWDRLVIKAVGQGMLPGDMESQSEAEKIARECALADARRNLESTVLAVRVAGENSVRKVTAESENLKSAVAVAVASSTVISERQLPDRSFEVILQMPLTGKRGLMSFVAGTLLPEVEDRRTARARIPSGLIIDARGLGVKPAISPAIYASDGRLLYGAQTVGARAGIENGLANYPDDIGRAMKSPRTGNKPLVVKALKRGPKLATDIVVSNADALLISMADETAGILQECRVSIVTGSREGGTR